MWHVAYIMHVTGCARWAACLIILRGLIDLDLLDGEVRVHGRGLLDGLGQRLVVVDRIAVRLDGDL